MSARGRIETERHGNPAEFLSLLCAQACGSTQHAETNFDAPDPLEEWCGSAQIIRPADDCADLQIPVNLSLDFLNFANVS